MFLDRIRRLCSPPVTHDYRGRSWGHDYVFTATADGQGTMQGWGPRGGHIEAGDYLILATDDPQGTRYRVEAVSYYHDPPDMWRARVSFAPRTAEERT